MDIFILILTSISLILNIISEIISIKCKNKDEKTSTNSKLKITCITTETKVIEIKSD